MRNGIVLCDIWGDKPPSYLKEHALTAPDEGHLTGLTSAGFRIEAKAVYSALRGGR